jgi:trehalose synthase
MLMKRTIKDYVRLAGRPTINEILHRGWELREKHIVCVSSTYQGGGVAEMLNTMIPLFDDVGLKLGWRILHGTPDFFTITKKLHNALQGEKINLSARKKEIYLETNHRFSRFTHLDHDLVMIHDPQPLPLITFYEKRQPWVFRLHVDATAPNPVVWDFLKTFINRYDRFIVSHNDYKKDDITIPQTLVFPAIDPLSLKNKHISAETSAKYLAKFGIKKTKPIITQVSRFDKFKDPLGVLKVFDLVRKRVDCQLVLIGSLAKDDPEGETIYSAVKRAREKHRYQSDIILLLVENNILVNALQRESAVVIQKSTREGFGLVVAEALYKKTPVVGSRVGGIPFQIIDGETGFLHEPTDIAGFAESVLRLMQDGELRKRLGQNGHEHIKSNFLITRLMLDWLNVFREHLVEEAIPAVES